MRRRNAARGGRAPHAARPHKMHALMINRPMPGRADRENLDLRKMDSLSEMAGLRFRLSGRAGYCPSADCCLCSGKGLGVCHYLPGQLRRNSQGISVAGLCSQSFGHPHVPCTFRIPRSFGLALLASPLALGSGFKFSGPVKMKRIPFMLNLCQLNLPLPDRKPRVIATPNAPAPMPASSSVWACSRPDWIWRF